MERKSGILLHITSLPNKYGIGSLGEEAYKFVDFLKDSGQRYWQVLPVGPTTFKDSPYQSFSAFAGNPYFIDLDFLAEEGLLNQDDLTSYISDEEYINFDRIYNTRFDILRKAYGNFKADESYSLFLKNNNYWLQDYALFMTIKGKFKGASWLDWPEEYIRRDNKAIEKVLEDDKDEVGFWIFIQYMFDYQWNALKTYANQNGIKIIGDMPIYVAMDSADVWCDPKSWQIDENYKPVKVAGCPPDMFSPLGQLWGNPLYNYDYMKENDYNWWILRTKKSFELFDVLRIDHFRGFEAYYTIEYGRSDATVGEWEKGPNVELFKKIKEELGDVEIIAEDLGFLTEEVHIMLKNLGYPGMKIFQFGFNKGEINAYSPRNIIENCVLYPGTHDNPTLKGWFSMLDDENKEFVLSELNTNKRNFVYSMIKKCFMSKADTVIIPMQDYLELDDKARMNIPGTDEGNWVWKLKGNEFTKTLSKRINNLVKKYSR